MGNIDKALAFMEAVIPRRLALGCICTSFSKLKGTQSIVYTVLSSAKRISWHCIEGPVIIRVVECEMIFVSAYHSPSVYCLFLAADKRSLTESLTGSKFEVE